jgi:hypothetical protein
MERLRKITIDKSGANAAAIESHNAEHAAGIEIRQIKHLNNTVEGGPAATEPKVRFRLETGLSGAVRGTAFDPKRTFAPNFCNVQAIENAWAGWRCRILDI